MPLLPMMLLAGIFNGVGDFFSKLTAGRISPYIAGSLVSLFSGLTVFLYWVLVKGVHGNSHITKLGFIYSALGGISIGFGVILFFTLFNRGANVSQVQPIVKTAVVLSAVLLGLIVLREKVTVYQVVGMLLSVVGIYFLTK